MTAYLTGARSWIVKPRPSTKRGRSTFDDDDKFLAFPTLAAGRLLEITCWLMMSSCCFHDGGGGDLGNFLAVRVTDGFHIAAVVRYVRDDKHRIVWWIAFVATDLRIFTSDPRSQAKRAQVLSQYTSIIIWL